MVLGGLKQIYFETKVYTSHEWLWALKKQDICTMSDQIYVEMYYILSLHPNIYTLYTS